MAFLVRPDKNRNRFFAFFTLAIFLVVGTNVAISQPEGISGCVNKKTGILRIAAKCSSSERTIQWSVFGPQGPQGPKGDAGDRGVQGLPGLSIVSGKGMPNAFVGEEGDFYIDALTYKIYGPKKGESWGEPRDLVGPKGDTGPIGPQGSKGEIGPAGPAGPTGAQGPAGTQGPPGGPGAQGPAGVNGRDSNDNKYLYVGDESGTLLGDFRGFYKGVYYFKSQGKIWGVQGSSIVQRQVLFENDSCTPEPGSMYVSVNRSAATGLPDFTSDDYNPILASIFINNLDYNSLGINRQDNLFLSQSKIVENMTTPRTLYYKDFSSGNCNSYWWFWGTPGWLVPVSVSSLVIPASIAGNFSGSYIISD